MTGSSAADPPGTRCIVQLSPSRWRTRMRAPGGMGARIGAGSNELGLPRLEPHRHNVGGSIVDEGLILHTRGCDVVEDARFEVHRWNRCIEDLLGIFEIGYPLIHVERHAAVSD